jgi:hypothetical protein
MNGKLFSAHRKVRYIESNTGGTFIIYLLNTFKILPRYGCIWIKQILTLAMETKIAGKRSIECKQNN